MGGSNKKKPQRTGSKKESISKILKNSELNQRNINVIPSNLAAIVKASSLKQSESSGSASSSGSAGHGASSGSSSLSGSGFGLRVTLLCMLYLGRFGFVMFPQHGYMMPDEFFQSTEPIAGDSLNVTSLKTWEFNHDFPIRSMFFPQTLFGPVYYLIKSFSKSSTDSSNLSNITAYALLVGPRLVIALFSLFIDFSILKICKILYSPGQNSGIFLTTKMLDILLIHASSYLAFTYYCHTFSNTVETVLFALLLLWIIDSTTTTVKGRSCPNIRIGSVLALGFFNRPTFALYAFAPVITWLLFYTPSSTASQRAKIAAKNTRPGVFVSGVKNIIVNSCRLVGPFTVFTILMVMFDTWYYRGSEKMLELANFESFEPMQFAKKVIDTVVLTPGNFMIYNLQSKNLANHGFHPFYFHGLVSFPLMFSLLGVMWYLDVVTKLSNGRLRLNSCGINVLHGSIFAVLVGFSVIPHQEPRFLLGLIVPLVCLLGHQIYGSTALFTLWVIFNGALTVFYGHIHQAGVTASLFDIRANIVRPYEIQTVPSLPPTHIIFLRQYLPPRHLLAVSSSLQSQIQLHDLSVTDFPQSFHKQLSELDSVRNNANIFITGPGCLSIPFQLELNSLWPGATLKSVHEYFPHFTGEDFDKSMAILKDSDADESESVNSLLTRLYRAFSFGVWKVDFGAQNPFYDSPNSVAGDDINTQEQQSELKPSGEESSEASNNEQIMTEQNEYEFNSQSQQS